MNLYLMYTVNTVQCCFTLNYYIYVLKVILDLALFVILQFVICSYFITDASLVFNNVRPLLVMLVVLVGIEKYLNLKYSLNNLKKSKTGPICDSKPVI